MLTAERDYHEEARKHLVEEEYAEILEKLAESGAKYRKTGLVAKRADRVRIYEEKT